MEAVTQCCAGRTTVGCGGRDWGTSFEAKPQAPATSLTYQYIPVPTLTTEVCKLWFSSHLQCELSYKFLNFQHLRFFIVSMIAVIASYKKKKD